MTVWIYVDTSKEVGDADRLKVFATIDAAKNGSIKTIPRAWPLRNRFWNKQEAAR